jgi:hypothetical protein
MARGTGGSIGGVGSFFLGLAMLVGGVYLLLQSITVSNGFSIGYGYYHMGGFAVTGGMILLPAVIGIAMVFWNSRNYFGWLLFVGSLVALIFGVIASLQFHLRSMSLFELLTILVLVFGGTGLFLRSLQD